MRLATQEPDGPRRRYRRKIRPTFDYNRYIRSIKWKYTAEVKRREVNFRCQYPGCTYRGPHLEVHHNHYGTLGQERMADLTAYCPPHHAHVHGKGAKVIQLDIFQDRRKRKETG